MHIGDIDWITLLVYIFVGCIGMCMMRRVVIPMIIYAIFYSLNVLLHLENGRPSVNYDIYGFLEGRVSLILIVLPFMILLTYFISFVLWKVNKLKNKTGNSK